MELTIDIHSHSSYAGGASNISLDQLASSMVLKGIDVLGTGDCLFPKWRKVLEESLEEKECGIFSIQYPKECYYGLSSDRLKSAKFVLQTELIFTFGSQGVKKRKRMDIICLFPSFKTLDVMIKLLEKWHVKNTVGRPFVVCKDKKEVDAKIVEIAQIHTWIEIIPAHVMTPQGIFGSINEIRSLSETLPNSLRFIHAVETGLSANPAILDLIPELTDFVFLSNSDLHSANLNRVGREFTCLSVSKINYRNVIQSIRLNNVLYTFEFMPEEGRYFLTGIKVIVPLIMENFASIHQSKLRKIACVQFVIKSYIAE